MTTEMGRVSPNEARVVERHQAIIPVKVSALAQDLGLSVLSATLPAGIAGEIRPAAENNSYIVRVNRHDSKGRQRFTVAHEIAHFLIHRDYIGSGISDDVLYRSALSDSREAEANRLAAEILMPADKVRATFAAAEGVEAKITKLAEEFNVSEAAMRIRLEIMGLI